MVYTYIRTGKEYWGDIYEAIGEEELYWVVKTDKDVKLIPKCNVTNQSDMIEELCDKFVLRGIGLIHLNKEHTKYHFEGSDERLDITDTELKLGIYGAIWAEKGLIYVAKMNDKKKFKLLGID